MHVFVRSPIPINNDCVGFKKTKKKTKKEEEEAIDVIFLVKIK